MKILLSATTSWNLYNSRLGLANALKNRGHEVVFLSPRDAHTPLLIQEGFRWINLPLNPRGKNPLREWVPILSWTLAYVREKPDLVNHFTPKGVVYGSLAARLAGVRRVFNTITGLGTVFSESGDSGLQQAAIALYRLSLARTTIIWQNKDDADFFRQERIGDPERSFLIPGSGVDMDRFRWAPEPIGAPVVLLPSRFVEEKGIRYFVEASRILRSRKVEARFVVVGRPEEDQPTAIGHHEITAWMNAGLIEWWGWHENMEQIYPLAHIVCLPTYYREGIPKSLTEAAACGRPLVATDVPGCREIVHANRNGLLVPPRDAQALANAIEQLAADPGMRLRMGQVGREIVSEKFSMETITDAYISVYRI